MALAGYLASFGLELADFARAVATGAASCVPSVPTDSGLSQPEHALGELEVALALYRSAETGAWEDVWRGEWTGRAARLKR